MEFVSFLKLLNRTEGFGCGFVVFGCFSQFLNLFLFLLMSVLGFKLLQFKVPFSSPPVLYLCDDRQKVNGFKSKNDFDNLLGQKNTICSSGIVSDNLFSSGVHHENMNFPAGFPSDNDFSEAFDLKSKNFSNGFSLNNHTCDGFDQKKDISCIARNPSVADDDQGSLDEDQIFDVIVLRNMVKEERKRANDFHKELEKERMAAASAAEEAMAMLLKLRIEKSVAEREAGHYKRVTEEKQEYDQRVIQGLQWMLMKHEEDRKVLENRLRFCIQKLKMYAGSEDHDEDDDKINEMFEELFFSSAVEGEVENENAVESQGI